MGVHAASFWGVVLVTAFCAGCGLSVRGDGCCFGAGLSGLSGLVYGAGGSLRGVAEAEDHAGEDGEGGEALKGRDGAGAG